MLIPNFSSNNTGAKKAFRISYKENPIEKSNIKANLRKTIKESNVKVIKVALFWIAILFLITVLFYFNVIGVLSLYLLIAFFIFTDALFINFWCLFRKLITGSKCCNTCRIHNWGPILAFSPLILIPTFWTYTILFFAFLILIQWEYLHWKHPKRFYEITNNNLQCQNCIEKCPNCILNKSV
jgi:hypothetical protein